MEGSRGFAINYTHNALRLNARATVTNAACAASRRDYALRLNARGYGYERRLRGLPEGLGSQWPSRNLHAE